MRLLPAIMVMHFLQLSSLLLLFVYGLEYTNRLIMMYSNRKYLKWVKSLDCVVCHRPADDPHHITGVGNLSGMGMKPPDVYAIPVCRECHTHIHNTPEIWHEQWQWVARTLARAVQEGVFK